MTCTTCYQGNVRTDLTPTFGRSILGREIFGRSTAGYDYRTVGDGMYGLGQERGDVIYNGTRQYGTPKTDAERMASHYAQYGNRNLPARGTGQAKTQKLEGEFSWGTLFGGAFVGLFLGYLLFAKSGREIGYAAGQRVAKKIRG